MKNIFKIRCSWQNAVTKAEIYIGIERENWKPVGVKSKSSAGSTDSDKRDG